MVSHLGHFAIESNTRLHPQGAAATAMLDNTAATPLQAAAVPACPTRGDLALCVDGWYQQNHLHSLQQHQQQQPSEYSSVHGRLASTDSSSPGAKRPYDTDASSQPNGGKRSRGFRINDLLNPAVAAAAPALAAAHNMTVPTSLGRTRSADSKHYYQQIAQLQLRLQNQQQQQPQQIPAVRLPRTSTAPVESAADLCAQGLVREALELDKLYDIACVIIESIWPHHSVSQRTQLCSLRCFVAETHRQSRLSLDALELCMFYLLRAKSIIQAKQRASRQHEEQQEQEQQKATAAQVQQNLANYTPPLSPCSPQAAAAASNNGKGATASVTASSSVTVGGGYSTAAMVVPVGGGPSSGISTDRLISPPSSSPFTPGSAQQMGHAITYIGMDKQHLLSNDMISTVDADNKPKHQQHQHQHQQHQQRAIAGSTGTLPISYRTFVAPANKQQLHEPTATVSKAPLSSAAAAAAAADDDDAPKQPVSPSEKGNEVSGGGRRKQNVTKCGRRMFVAALICASKFMFDRTYSNKAWNKITKLPLAQISDMERAFLDMIDYRLYVDRSTYDKFHRLLARSGMRNGRLMVCDPLSSSSPSPPTMASASPLPSPTRITTPHSAVADNTKSVMGSGATTSVPSPASLSLSTEQQQQLIKAPRMSSIQLASVSSTPISPTAVVPNSADLRAAAMNVPMSIYQHQQHAMGFAHALNSHQHVQYHQASGYQ
ncbi:PHO85 cyclin-5 [Coemansia sp. RSA 1813]|nr:PHO85 cyclin-5 [Coemansia sp. RSA 986]KAJ2214836.1 PHO85 cyclin-5 [Coemansia sp. RSA 487]KAJ2567845.1 PHO85 cyclin-5 [Coemansia sp. RSA 1813]